MSSGSEKPTEMSAQPSGGEKILDGRWLNPDIIGNVTEEQMQLVAVVAQGIEELPGQALAPQLFHKRPADLFHHVVEKAIVVVKGGSGHLGLPA